MARVDRTRYVLPGIQVICQSSEGDAEKGISSRQYNAWKYATPELSCCRLQSDIGAVL
jgi:hypothetical protein